MHVHDYAGLCKDGRVKEMTMEMQSIHTVQVKVKKKEKRKKEKEKEKKEKKESNEFTNRSGMK